MSLGTPQEMLDDERDYNESLKDKAKELVSKFSSKLPFYSEKDNLSKAKQCALICVDEIINTGVHTDYIKVDGYMLSLVEFYTEVKEEINKLWI